MDLTLNDWLNNFRVTPNILTTLKAKADVKLMAELDSIVALPPDARRDALVESMEKIKQLADA